MTTDTSISYEEHLDDMQELAPYIDLMQDSDEFEQAARALYDFYGANYLSDEFQQAYRKEIKATLEWLKDNVEIKEKKEEVVTKVRAYKYLEYEHDRD